MAENRLTYHNGYRDKNRKPYGNKHNQREGFEKPKNADKNVYWDYQVWGTKTFSESEKMLYKYAFGDFVKTHNEKCKKRGQYARCITVEQYREKHPPEETLLYLGTENVNVEALKATFEDFREWIKQECNTDTCGIELLNAALHMDEATPHIHFRKVYWCTDKDGNAQISQTGALKALGYERPDETRKEGRFNNVKMTFDAVCREKLFEFAKSHGVELETKPLPKNEVGLSIDEYRAREQAREAWKAEQDKLCVDAEKAKQAVEKSNAEIKQNEEIIRDQRQKIGNMREFYEFTRKKSEEQEEQEAQKVREERERIKEEVQRKLADVPHKETQPINSTKNASRQTPQIAIDKGNPRENVQKAPETHENVSRYPNTSSTEKLLEERNKLSVNDVENSMMDFLSGLGF